MLTKEEKELFKLQLSMDKLANKLNTVTKSPVKLKTPVNTSSLLEQEVMEESVDRTALGTPLYTPYTPPIHPYTPLYTPIHRYTPLYTPIPYPYTLHSLLHSTKPLTLTLHFPSLPYTPLHSPTLPYIPYTPSRTHNDQERYVQQSKRDGEKDVGSRLVRGVYVPIRCAFPLDYTW